MECGEDLEWNNVSVNVESLYSTLEVIQQGRKEVFVSVVCYELSIEIQLLNDTLIIDSMKRILICKVEWKLPGWMNMIGYLFRLRRFYWKQGVIASNWMNGRELE